jgi:hypothetical protein
MKTKWVDLHAHSCASDGDLSPRELVDKACDIGLAALAITDHDTIQGIEEALHRASSISIEVVPGVEISVEGEMPGTFHMLGYYIDWRDPELRDTLERLQNARSERNLKILRRLEELGMPLDEQLLGRLAAGGQLGRPHMAKAMVQCGYVSSTEEAFQRYLKKGGPAYVDKFRLSPKEAIRMIRRAGGIAVLAHPGTLRPGSELELEALTKDLCDEGLMGIEVKYPEHTPQQEALYAHLAGKYGLLMTGGTDFHGSAKPQIHLGWGRGDLRVPLQWAQRLKEAHICSAGARGTLNL